MNLKRSDLWNWATTRINYLEHSSRESEVVQSCLTLCDPMDCSLPCSSIHGIFQARVLEWVAISFSIGSSQPRVQTWVSHIVGRCFTAWATREVNTGILDLPKPGIEPRSPRLQEDSLPAEPREARNIKAWVINDDDDKNDDMMETIGKRGEWSLVIPYPGLYPR